MLKAKGFVGALILAALTISVLITFKYDWWNGYVLKNPDYLLILGFISASLALLENKVKYIFIVIALFFINYFGIGPVIAVAIFWLTACLIGKKSFFLIYKNNSIESKFLENSALGFSIIGLVVTISSHFQINTGLFYISLFACFYAYLGNAEISSFLISIKRSSQAILKINFLPIYFLIICMGYLYMVTVIPDLGHDSLAMHLNVPKLIAENLKWNYDINEYVWSVLPMGVEMLYVPTYIFGGEDAIRILNLTFVLASAMQIYIIAKRYYSSENIAILFGVVLLSTPIIFYLLGSSFVEPCYIFFILVAFSFLLDKAILWVPLAIILGYACTMRITGILFMPAILACYIVSHYKKDQWLKRLITLICIFLIFSSIPYAYSYIITGSPVFPLMNEIFKSELWSKSAFYHPLYVNNLGLANLWQMVFNSKKYGEFSANGAIGIATAIAIPIQLIYLILHWKDLPKYKSEICIFFAGLLYVISMIYVQAYLRYIFPGLVLIYLSLIIILAKAEINLNVIKILLITLVTINILKIPYASTYFPGGYDIYFDRSAKLSYTTLHRPYAVVGQIISKFPEYKDSKILLVGYGYDPVYYYYPKNTVAYSWHSSKAFDLINSHPDDLGSVVNKLGVNLVVCPVKQSKEDTRHFSDQCQSISSKLFITNGVYVGVANPK